MNRNESALKIIADGEKQEQRDAIRRAADHAQYVESELRSAFGTEDPMLFILLEDLLLQAVNLRQKLARIDSELPA